LIDEVAHGERVILGRAKDQRFFILVDLVHEYLHAVRFTFLDLDDLVEVGFRVALSGLDFALDQFVVRRVDITAVLDDEIQRLEFFGEIDRAIPRSKYDVEVLATQIMFEALIIRNCRA